MKKWGWLRRVMSALAVALPLLITIVCSESYAQTTIGGGGPSLEETKTWLTEQIANSKVTVASLSGGTEIYEEIDTYEDVAMNGCVISCVWKKSFDYSEEYTRWAKNPQNNVSKDALNRNSSTRISVDLATLDPLSCKVDAFMGDDKHEAGDAYHVYCHNGRSGSGLRGIRVIFGDNNTAQRVERALSYAIKLCGGKVSPF